MCNELHGYFEIGIWKPKTETNVGTLWRSAYQLGASGLFVIGQRYTKRKQSSDTPKAWRHIPLREYKDWSMWYETLPYDARVVGVEIGGRDLRKYVHPQRCVYLLGAEDHGLQKEALACCHEVISIPAVQRPSYNVSVAGSIVMYDRAVKCMYV